MVPRKLRMQYPGAIYHFMNRGDQREEIFRGEQDWETFLATLSDACRRTGWIVNRLHMGSWIYVSNLLKGRKETPTSCQIALPLLQ